MKYIILRNKRFLLRNKQHFYKQQQAEIGKKIKQKLSNTLRMTFRYFKIIRFLHPHYHSKIIDDILKIIQKANTSILMKFYDYDNENESENEKSIKKK